MGSPSSNFFDDCIYIRVVMYIVFLSDFKGVELRGTHAVRTYILNDGNKCRVQMIGVNCYVKRIYSDTIY